MNARMARTRSIVVAHDWEPEPSAAYAALDRAISDGLAELLSRNGHYVRRSPRGATGRLTYLHLLGRVIQFQARANHKPQTWLGQFVTCLRQWMLGTEQSSVQGEAPRTVSAIPLNRAAMTFKSSYRR